MIGGINLRFLTYFLKFQLSNPASQLSSDKTVPTSNKQEGEPKKDLVFCAQQTRTS